MKEIRIGNIVLKNKVLLAPMAGVTDLTFRTICKEFGAALVYTEMVSAKGIHFKDKKTKQLMKIRDKNRPVALQIFGSDPEIMKEVVIKYLNQIDDIDILDINMGCPAPKIVKNGDGSALMKDPKLAGKIVNAVKKASNKPVTVKTRIGWDEDNINVIEFAKILEENGADCITIHGRTREQFYSGKADINMIKSVKESIRIPVIGNGDIFSPEDAKHMLEYTKCDGIMIGRGILGNPWLISNTINYIENGVLQEKPKVKEKIFMLKRHTKMLEEEINEKKAVLEMRKHAGWYIKGIKNATDLRSKINKVSDIKTLFNILDNYLLSHNNQI